MKQILVGVLILSVSFFIYSKWDLEQKRKELYHKTLVGDMEKERRIRILDSLDKVRKNSEEIARIRAQM